MHIPVGGSTGGDIVENLSDHVILRTFHRHRDLFDGAQRTCPKGVNSKVRCRLRPKTINLTVGSQGYKLRVQAFPCHVAKSTLNLYVLMRSAPSAGAVIKETRGGFARRVRDTSYQYRTQRCLLTRVKRGAFPAQQFDNGFDDGTALGLLACSDDLGKLRHACVAWFPTGHLPQAGIHRMPKFGQQVSVQTITDLKNTTAM